MFAYVAIGLRTQKVYLSLTKYADVKSNILGNNLEY